jgi:hypothetical protein
MMQRFSFHESVERCGTFVCRLGRKNGRAGLQRGLVGTSWRGKFAKFARGRKSGKSLFIEE